MTLSELVDDLRMTRIQAKRVRMMLSRAEPAPAEYARLPAAMEQRAISNLRHVIASDTLPTDSVVMEFDMYNGTIKTLAPGSRLFFVDSPFGDMGGQVLAAFTHPEDLSTLVAMSTDVAKTGVSCERTIRLLHFSLHFSPPACASIQTSMTSSSANSPRDGEEDRGGEEVQQDVDSDDDLSLPRLALGGTAEWYDSILKCDDVGQGPALSSDALNDKCNEGPLPALTCSHQPDDDARSPSTSPSSSNRLAEGSKGPFGRYLHVANYVSLRVRLLEIPGTNSVLMVSGSYTDEVSPTPVWYHATPLCRYPTPTSEGPEPIVPPCKL